MTRPEHPASPIPAAPITRRQSLVTLDLEGVLVPEIWIAVAEKTAIDGLKATTRDIPDYDELMRNRLNLLHQHQLTLRRIQDVIETLHPLPGAKGFLDRLRSRTQVIILSDTFEEFAKPLMRQLDWPTLFCHRLQIEAGEIAGYQLRQRDQKKNSVAALRSLNFKVISAGDSYNDTTMLREADVGCLFRAPQNVKDEFPQFPAFETYDALLSAIENEL